MSIKMIAAVNPQGIIGSENKIPWHHPEDMKFFRRMTAESTVIMGRKTWLSLGCKPLPKRKNIVITSSAKENGYEKDGVIFYSTLKAALDDNHYKHIEEQCFCLHPDIWLIGGASIYQEGMKHAEKIYLTLVPDKVEGKELVQFPWINPTRFQLDSHSPEPFDENPKLQLLIYNRIE